MSKVYREMKSGVVDAQEATKQVWVLIEIRKAIEAESKTPAAQNANNEPLTVQIEFIDT